MLVMHESGEWKAVDQIFGWEQLLPYLCGANSEKPSKAEEANGEFTNIKRREIQSITVNKIVSYQAIVLYHKIKD